MSLHVPESIPQEWYLPETLDSENDISRNCTLLVSKENKQRASVLKRDTRKQIRWTLDKDMTRDWLPPLAIRELYRCHIRVRGANAALESLCCITLGLTITSRLRRKMFGS
jgi:hypothetical protein